MTPPPHHNAAADPQKEKRLRSLHPVARRRQRRRWRWMRVAVSSGVTGLLYGGLVAAHDAVLRATNDSDPALGSMITFGIVFALSLSVFVVLLGGALVAELLDLMRRER